MPSVTRITRSLGLIAVLLTALATGCTPETEPPATLESPSEAYLASAVEPGWIRSVEATDGLVLIFECESEALANDDWRYQFKLFNEGDVERTWDHVVFVVGFERVDGTDGNGSIGGLPIGGRGTSPDPPSLSLGSGESTTVAGGMLGALGMREGTYWISPLVRQADIPHRAIISAPDIEIRSQP